MRDWPLAPIKLMIAHIPRIAIDPSIDPGPLSAKYNSDTGEFNENLVSTRDSEAPVIEASGKSGRRRIGFDHENTLPEELENEIFSEKSETHIVEDEKNKELDIAVQKAEDPDDEEFEVDYMHPSSFWGYKQRLEESGVILYPLQPHFTYCLAVRAEAKRSRMSMDIVAPLGPDGSASLRDDEGECLPGILLTLPYCAHDAAWFPDEIGVRETSWSFTTAYLLHSLSCDKLRRSLLNSISPMYSLLDQVLIGRLFADEWELDYITLVLTDLVTSYFSENAAQYRYILLVQSIRHCVINPTGGRTLWVTWGQY